MLDKIANVGVVGAGTMGIGIAEVAAAHGQSVYLYDLDKKFAQTAKAKMQKRMESRVERGKISQAKVDDILSRIQIVDQLHQFSSTDLVIEAIVENLEIKQNLFAQLESICDSETLLATNTSSISVTAIASALSKPERMLGLHFFNPAPVMKLVEVISGLKTSNSVMQIGQDLCEFWNKVGVKAKSTPGFIVNRVARPFYGEALKMLQEDVYDVESIDSLMKNAGFRMGPFQLMDLIGIDVNLAVSQTVYETMFYDPRYRPSLIQQEMVYAGQLGKKTHAGFYDYAKKNTIKALPFEEIKYSPNKILINSISSDLVQWVSESSDSGHLSIEIDKLGCDLIVEQCSVILANGQTCEQNIKGVSSQGLCQVDWVLSFEKAEFVNLSFNKSCPKNSKDKVIGLFQSLGKEVLVSGDSPALCVTRIVSMLMNEAADAVTQGVCSELDVDLAMTNGVNYPIGLLKWSKKVGYTNVVSTLEALHNWFGDDRYRVSSWLRVQ